MRFVDEGSVITYTYDGTDGPSMMPQVREDNGRPGVLIYVDNELIEDFILRGGDIADLGLAMNLDDVLQCVVDNYERGWGGTIDGVDGAPWVARLRQWADAIESRMTTADSVPESASRLHTP